MINLFNKVRRYIKAKNKTLFVWRPSELANHYLKGKRGIEIGGSHHNRFELNTLNVNYTDEKTDYTKDELKFTNKAMKVDIIAPGDDLPFKDNVWDFVINSHVLEHFFDPIKAIDEWMRVIKPGGYLFMIIPHKERTPDEIHERTQLKELIDRHSGLIEDPKMDMHHSIWITEDVIELCQYMGLNVVDSQNKDDKVGNGFTIVIQKGTQ